MKGPCKRETQKAWRSQTAGAGVRVTALSGPQAPGVCRPSPHTHLNIHLPSQAHTHHLYKISAQEISAIPKWSCPNKLPLTECSELLDCVKWEEKWEWVRDSTMNSLLGRSGHVDTPGYSEEGYGISLSQPPQPPRCCHRLLDVDFVDPRNPHCMALLVSISLCFPTFSSIKWNGNTHLARISFLFFILEYSWLTMLR